MQKSAPSGLNAILGAIHRGPAAAVAPTPAPAPENTFLLLARSDDVYRPPQSPKALPKGTPAARGAVPAGGGPAASSGGKKKTRVRQPPRPSKYERKMAKAVAKGELKLRDVNKPESMNSDDMDISDEDDGGEDLNSDELDERRLQRELEREDEAYYKRAEALGRISDDSDENNIDDEDEENVDNDFVKPNSLSSNESSGGSDDDDDDDDDDADEDDDDDDMPVAVVTKKKRLHKKADRIVPDDDDPVIIVKAVRPVLAKPPPPPPAPVQRAPPPNLAQQVTLQDVFKARAATAKVRPPAGLDRLPTAAEEEAFVKAAEEIVRGHLQASLHDNQASRQWFSQLHWGEAPSGSDTGVARQRNQMRADAFKRIMLDHAVFPQ